MMWGFEGIRLGKWAKRKTFTKQTPSHFRRFNLSLMSCSPAVLISVSFEHDKYQRIKLYLQPVENGNHLPILSNNFCSSKPTKSLGVGYSWERFDPALVGIFNSY